MLHDPRLLGRELACPDQCTAGPKTKGRVDDAAGHRKRAPLLCPGDLDGLKLHLLALGPVPTIVVDVYFPTPNARMAIDDAVVLDLHLIVSRRQEVLDELLAREIDQKLAVHHDLDVRVGLLAIGRSLLLGDRQVTPHQQAHHHSATEIDGSPKRARAWTASA